MPVKELASIARVAERGPVNRYTRSSSTHASIETWVELFLTAILRYTPFFPACAPSFVPLRHSRRLFTRLRRAYLSSKKTQSHPWPSSLVLSVSGRELSFPAISYSKRRLLLEELKFLF